MFLRRVAAVSRCHVVNHQQYVSQLFFARILQFFLYQLFHSSLLSLRQCLPPVLFFSPYARRAASAPAAAAASRSAALTTI